MAKINYKFDGSIQANIEKDTYTRFFTYLSQGNWLLDVLKSFITVGISPVYQAGRFQRYSESYKDFIKGKVRFVTMNGKVLAYTNGFKKDKKGNTTTKSALFPPPIPGKKISPVSMTATGAMLDSMYLDKRNNKIVVGISDEKAKYHNDLGAGKSKVIRRLLPTKSGERFITNIDSRLKRLGKLAVQNALNDKKSLLVVNYIFRGK
jgi:hypothetical protein